MFGAAGALRHKLTRQQAAQPREHPPLAARRLGCAPHPGVLYVGEAGDGR